MSQHCTWWSVPTTRPVGKYERAAYTRQERDLRAAYGDAWDSVESYGDPSLSTHPKGYWYDADAGERAVTFIERYCRHHKGEWSGRPLVLEEWQKLCIRVSYGWMRMDGTRRFRISYREVPRKNGKTEQAGGEAAFLLVADGEPGAEVYSTATKEEQAKIVWSATKEMIRQSPALRKYVTPRTKHLLCARLGSVFRPLGADSDTLDGLNPHAHICDEMHAHKKRGVWDVMITGMGARRQPVTIVITTAGVYSPESIGWELHEHAQQVLDGVVEDDTFFAIIFAADTNDDWREEATWYKANPNLGVSVKLDYLREQCERAKTQPSALNTFLRLHLNIWTQQITRWIPVEHWNNCRATLMPVEQRPRRDAYLGLDLASTQDVAALAIDIPDGEFHDFYYRFYVPQQRVLERARLNKSPDYAAWQRDGWLVATPGNGIDYEFIRRDIVKLAATLNIKQIGYDPWNATQLGMQLQSDGLTLVELRQGYQTLSEPSKQFEQLVLSGRLRHNGDPVMAWMVNNAAIRHDANDNIAPDKSSAAGKIDGVVASIMAIRCATLAPSTRKSIYETRGVRLFG